MQNPPLSIGLTSTQLAILIFAIVLSLCAAFMLGMVSGKNRTQKDLRPVQREKEQLNHQEKQTDIPPEQPSDTLSKSTEAVSPSTEQEGHSSQEASSPESKEEEGKVVEKNREEEKAPKVEKASPPPPVIRYAVQVGAYGSLENAQRALGHIRGSRWLVEQQLPNWVQESTNGSLYFVWIGEFDTYNQALQSVPKIQKGLQLRERLHVKKFLKLVNEEIE